MSRDRLTRVTVLALMAALLVGLPDARAQQAGFAKITAVLLTVTHRTRQDRPWRPSKVGTMLLPGSAVRTGRRSKCQITFPDGSFIRMGERSDLIITDLTGKRVRLQAGRLYVKIVAGTAAVEGHTAVAAVKGTAFEFIGPAEIPPPGQRPPESVRVYDGFVDFTVGGRTTTVGAGTEATGKPDGTITRQNTPSQNYPGGSYDNWAGGNWSGAEVTTTPNSSAGTAQKIQHLTEQQVAADPSRDAQRDEAREKAGLIQVIIAGRRQAATRGGAAPPLQLTEAPRSSGTRVAALPIAAVALAADAVLGQAETGGLAWEKRFYGPTAATTPYTFVGGEESVYGVRAVGSGVYGDYYVRVATDLSDRFEGDLDISLDEAFVAYRKRRTEWTLGRQRFLNGPVNNTEIGTLHDFGRVASVRWRREIRGGPALDGALMERAETYPGAAGEAAYLRAAQSIGPAVVGANVLWLFGDGPGQSVDLSISALSRKLDFYAELGEDPTGRDLHTIGLYFPKLYQRTGVDVFVEQAKRQGFSSVFSVAGYTQVTDNGTILLILEKPSGDNWNIGVGFAVQLGR